MARLLDRRESVLALLWLDPRRLEELREYGDVVEYLRRVGVAEVEDGVVVLRRERLHPLIARAVERLAREMEAGGEYVTTPP